MSCSRRSFLMATGGLALLGQNGWAATPTAPAPQDGRSRARRVLNRAAFGPRPGEVDRVAAMGVSRWLEEQLHPERIDDRACERRTRRLETLRCPAGELFEYKEQFLWRELATGKLLRACYSERQLFEVMVDFWSDHFNIDSSKGDCRWLKTADDRDVIRRHALGRFSDLLRASALGPAMLWYLDGRVNRRRSPEEAPNENYSRELLELHTLGVHGGYTQHDVMEVARCLTGWTVRTDTWFGKGRVEFNPDFHDGGPKRVLGEEIPAGLGRGDVDAVLRIVLRHPETARHLARKLCHRFIGPAFSSRTAALVADAFAASEGDTRAMLRALFASAEFRAPGPEKFKRPFHFVVSALRAAGSSVNEPDALLDYLARMGHSPFQYPTPDGYPEEAAPWMGSLLWRWHFVENLAHNLIAGVQTDWAARIAAAGGGLSLAESMRGGALTEAEMKLVHGGGMPGRILASPTFQGA